MYYSLICVFVCLPGLPGVRLGAVCRGLKLGGTANLHEGLLLCPVRSLVGTGVGEVAALADAVPANGMSDFARGTIRFAECGADGAGRRLSLP